MDDRLAQGQFLGTIGAAPGNMHGELPDTTAKLLADLIDVGAAQLKDGRGYQQDEWSQMLVAASRVLAFHNSIREQREMQAKLQEELAQSDAQFEAMKRAMQRN